MNAKMLTALFGGLAAILCVSAPFVMNSRQLAGNQSGLQGNLVCVPRQTEATCVNNAQIWIKHTGCEVEELLPTGQVWIGKVKCNNMIRRIGIDVLGRIGFLSD